MDGDQQIVGILKELVPKARYEYRGQSITGTEYRNAWNSLVPDLSRMWILAKVVRPQGFGGLVATLGSMLARFINADDGDELVRTNIGLIAAGVGGPTPLASLAESVLTSAVLIGSDRTVARLRAWANGEPVTYTKFIVLSGLRIEGDQQRFHVEEGFTIHSLPTNQADLLALDAPEMWVGSPMSLIPSPPGGPYIYGAPAMIVEMTLGPVFSKSKEMSLENRTAASGPLGQLDSLGVHAPPFAGLSLACNSLVSPSCAWNRFPQEVQSFAPWARLTANHTVLYHGDLSLTPPSSKLTCESLARSIDIAQRVVDHGLGNKSRTALARWAKSMQGQFADQFIDLRIALEALYAPDGGAGEISYRLQTRCARHMAKSFNDRLAIAREVKDFYNTASRFAHGSRADTPPEIKHQRQLERAQKICRDALIKIIDQNNGQDIDVNRLTLS